VTGGYSYVASATSKCRHLANKQEQSSLPDTQRRPRYGITIMYSMRPKINIDTAITDLVIWGTNGNLEGAFVPRGDFSGRGVTCSEGVECPGFNCRAPVWRQRTMMLQLIGERCHSDRDVPVGVIRYCCAGDNAETPPPIVHVRHYTQPVSVASSVL